MQQMPVRQLELNDGQRRALSQLARSGDARQLVQLLRREGDVDTAAGRASSGDAGELIERVQRLMRSKEGAQLIERLSREARERGLGQ